MSLLSLTGLGSGGAGLVDRVPKILKELQGHAVTVVPGAAAGTAIPLAALRLEDTIIGALYFPTAGGVVDLTGTLTVADCHASGTATVGTVVDGNNLALNGFTYTFRTTPGKGVVTDLAIGASPTASAANLAAAINVQEGSRLTGAQLHAVANAAVVTITAMAEGTAANAITLVGSTNVTTSGATLAGGTSVGSFKSTTATGSGNVVLVWFDRA